MSKSRINQRQKNVIRTILFVVATAFTLACDEKAPSKIPLFVTFT